MSPTAPCYSKASGERLLNYLRARGRVGAGGQQHARGHVAAAAQHERALVDVDDAERGRVRERRLHRHVVHARLVAVVPAAVRVAREDLKGGRAARR